MALKSIKLDTTARRALLPVAALVFLILAYLFARWFFASTIAGRVVLLEEQKKEIAAVAVNWGPSDPQAHLASALIHEETFLPEDLETSLREYEQATALSPHDYRLWLELGRARDRSGDTAGAELALKRALDLAPNYSQVQWVYGNFLLRQGNTDEAFAEIRKAVQGNNEFAGPAATVAWQVFDADLDQIKRYVGDSANLKSALAALLARDKRFEEAFEIWNSLPAGERREAFQAQGEEIYRQMLESGKYRAALQMYSQITNGADRKFAIGHIANGGFEEEVPKSPAHFDWQIADGAEPVIGVDNAHKRGGSLSLGFIFRNSDGKSFRSVSQTVAVEPGRRYVFETFYKSDLKAAATLRWEAVDVSNGTVLASTAPTAANTGWTSLKMEFTVPSGSEAVTLRLLRADCSSVCPINGRIWFDDFSLSAAE